MNNDHLPFVEKYRPNKLDDIMSHKNTIMILKNFIKVQNIPHLLFYGPPGTGKTSTIESFLTELYGEDNVEYMTMNINASEERGIEVVRNKIRNFVSTIPVYRKQEDNKLIPKYKFVILDEADAMTADAQAMLRQVIETYTFNARFCLICNYIKKVNDAIQSRCSIFKFSPLDFTSVKKKIMDIASQRNIDISKDGMETIWKLSNGDMRKVMHILQVVSINYNRIDSTIVTKFMRYPNKDDVDVIYKILRKADFTISLTKLRSIIKYNSYSLSDIITELSDKIIDDLVYKKIDNHKGIYILIKLRDIEMNITVTSDTDIQLCGIVGIFTNGMKN